MSSVALATAAFAGLSANAQTKESTQKAEHDHSSSDPGQENKVLLGENPDSNNPPPAATEKCIGTQRMSGLMCFTGKRVSR
jgi:hypothetical protein